jgi:hypothetical protein
MNYNTQGITTCEMHVESRLNLTDKYAFFLAPIHHHSACDPFAAQGGVPGHRARQRGRVPGAREGSRHRQPGAQQPGRRGRVPGREAPVEW